MNEELNRKWAAERGAAVTQMRKDRERLEAQLRDVTAERDRLRQDKAVLRDALKLYAMGWDGTARAREALATTTESAALERVEE